MLQNDEKEEQLIKRITLCFFWSLHCALSFYVVLDISEADASNYSFIHGCLITSTILDIYMILAFFVLICCKIPNEWVARFFFVFWSSLELLIQMILLVQGFRSLLQIRSSHPFASLLTTNSGQFILGAIFLAVFDICCSLNTILEAGEHV